MKKVKIGQELIITDDFRLEGFSGKNDKQVKKGDRAIITAGGYVEYITGEATGCIQILDKSCFEIDSYDVENMAKRILSRLINRHSVNEFLEDYEITQEEIQETIEEELDRILL